MKRSSGSAAQPADSASDRSTEQPADQTADDNSKRRKCDEQAKSASDAHPGHIDLAGATSTWHRRQLMKCIEEQCLELGIEMESLLETAAKRRQLVLDRLRGSAAQPVVDTTHEIEEDDMRTMWQRGSPERDILSLGVMVRQIWPQEWSVTRVNSITGRGFLTETYDMGQMICLSSDAYYLTSFYSVNRNEGSTNGLAVS